MDGRFVVHSSANFPNLFQTSAVNQGLRLEVSPQGVAGVVVATAGGAFAGVQSPDRVQRGKATSFTVSLDGLGKLSLRIGDRTVNQVVHAPAPKCNAVVVGSGFDENRGLSGGTAAINFRTGSKSPGSPLRNILAAACLALLTWVVAGTIAGPAPRRGSSRDG